LQEVLGEDAQRQSTHDLVRAILPGIIGWWYWWRHFPSLRDRQRTGLLAR
jgi:hypothetical protein